MQLFLFIVNTNTGDSMKILIVGGTSNIGYLLAKQLYLKGHSVYIGVHYKNEINIVVDKLLKEELCINVLKLDIESMDDRKKITRINPDCLIVHSSVGYGGTLLDMNIDVVRQNYEINVFSCFSLIQEFYKMKRKTKDKTKIFVTSSIAGYLPMPFLGSYSSTKSAITNICKALKYELKYLNSNISISVVEPGTYHTGFNQVMIDNKEKYIENPNIYKNINNLTRIQRNIFRLLEKDNYDDLVNKIIKEIDSDNPKFIIRRPIFQSILLKIYIILFG